ncbi:RagB/SusD family nutrient uptake outer membrane protein [Lewinella sp. LCG006]|uniref:RagB/SusD family nutrient uptake outer membrane protein n=1 Tax=Lewinella sp. LCG006 TaxID=3231911 RepID=UPI00345F7FF2
MHKLIMGLGMIGLLAFTACEVDVVNDPNNPSLGSVTADASKAELQLLVNGLEARQRGYVTNAAQMFGSFGREVYAFFGSDPRFLNDWLGLGGNAETYPDFFGSAGTYVNPYLAVKQANIMIEAANNSTKLSTEEAFGYTGFAKTIKGFQLLWPLMQQYQNGIRVDVEEPLNPGPTLSYDAALQAIRDILDEGFSDLDKAGDSFSFSLTSGFDGFNTPDAMAQVNRAIAARAALYAEDYGGALTALNASFMNLNAASAADLNVGPKHVYGNSPDVNNPLFYPIDAATSTILIVHPRMLEDALPGDGRVTAKFAERVNNPITDASLTDVATGDPIVGTHQDKRWATNTSSIPMIRNEELLLIYAEAQAREGGDAVSAINTIRNIWGVGNYTGAGDTNSLINEILFQRRYSLWLEGHHWVDMRRLGRLNEIPTREGGTIYTQVARRVSEISWDEG